MLANSILQRTILFALFISGAIYVSHQVVFLGWMSGDSMGASWIMWIEIFLPIFLVCVIAGAYLRSLSENIWFALVGAAIHQVYFHYNINGYQPPMLEFITDPDVNIAWTSGISAVMIALFLFLGVGSAIGAITGMRER